MPCIDDSGRLSESGEKLIKSLLSEDLDAKEISSRIGVPIFKVRSSIRELIEAGLIAEAGEKYRIMEKGKEMIKK